ncbi:curli polymerization inhibitor CsgI-related protein [Rodentibacter caecimuris]|uniref:UPF0319 protein BKG89_05375 n=1 Tax=Rodentibacter caecimuris TaxID=1796644 RepID=A0ABX3KYE7_9PAST|nr:hypothetical protein BKG89_05375 [Rodentibacter heylii]
MKLRTLTLGLTALLIGTSSFAGMVTTSTNVDIIAIDGQKVGKLLSKEKHSFNTNDNATHQAVIRVSELVGRASNQYLFESSPLIVTFQGSKEDIIISAPKLRTQSQADKFQKMPVISVKTLSGQDIPAKFDVLKQEGLFPSANVMSDLAEYNASDAVAAVPAFTTTMRTTPNTMNTATEKATKAKITVQGANVAEQQLQYWFQQADKETQVRFLNWAKKQK